MYTMVPNNIGKYKNILVGLNAINTTKARSDVSSIFVFFVLY